MRLRFLLVVLVMGLCALGMGKKKPTLSIRFYTQTTQEDTDSFSAPVTLLDGKQTYVDQIAAISERDIVSVYPFAVPDGTGGCAFKLDDHGTIALDSLSVQKRNSLLIATIAGRQVADLLIDQRVTDGIVTIPGGITTDEMKQILARFPVMGTNKSAKKGRKDVYSIGL